MDHCTVAGIIGKRGSGKTTLLKSLALDRRRCLMWDWRGGEFTGDVVTLWDLPQLFRQKTFRAVIRPHRDFSLVSYFDAVCSVIMDTGRDLTFCIDEAANVVENRKEGGLGLLLRCSRPNSIDLLWATQRPTGIPTTFLSETSTLHLFRLHHWSDVQALRGMVAPDVLAQLPTLAPHTFLTINL